MKNFFRPTLEQLETRLTPGRLSTANAVFPPLMAPAMVQTTTTVLNRIFIVSGQSNAVSVDTTTSGTLYKDLKAQYPNDNVKLIEVAASGYAMKYWIRVDGSHGPLYNSIVSKYRTATQNLQVSTLTFMFMQGEANANLREAGGYATNIGTYERRLRQLISDLRADLGQPSMEIVIGRISDKNTNSNWLAIREIQMRVALDVGGAWINTDDLNGPSNGIHYTVEGKIEFAHRLAGASITLWAENGY